MDNLRRIILVFSVSVFFALAICGIVLSFRNLDKPKETIIELSPTGKIYDGEETEETDPAIEEDITIPSALIVIMGEGDVKNLYFIAKIKNDNELSLMFLPQNSKISYKTDSGASLLSIDELKGKGMNVLCDALSGRFNISLSDYIVTDLNGFGNIVNYFSAGTQGVSFNYPVRHSFTLSGFKYDYSEASDYYDGAQARGIIAFTKTEDDSYKYPLSLFYDGNEIQRVKMASCFIKAFISQKLLDKASENTKNNYNYYINTFIQNNAETNLNEEQINKLSEVLLLCKSESVISLVYDYDVNDFYTIEISEEGYIQNKVTEY